VERLPGLGCQAEGQRCEVGFIGCRAVKARVWSPAVICKWGNSLAVPIPKAVADALKVSDGKRAEINVENGTLVLRPIVKPARKPRYTLDELLSGMTKDNVPQEVDWGPPRGNEAW
jgi:antitoxin MazE